MNPKDISDFLHQLADVQGAFESSTASLENPKGNHELAHKIQTTALQRMRFLTTEFRNKFKENPNMKTSDFALMGLIAMAPALAKAENPKKVALLLKASKNAFYDGIVSGAKEEASKHGIEITPFYGSHEDDWQSEVSFMEKEINNFDGFILDPIRSDAFTKILKTLNDSKKPVVIVDSPLTEGSEYVLSTVSSDNFVGGKLAALFIAGELERSNIPPKCVVHFSGNAKAKGHQDRNAGFLNNLHERLPKVEIKTYQGLSSYEQAKKIAGENIETISRCDAVFAGSDTMILGVLAALEEHKIRAPSLMVGYDAILEAQRKILDGKLTASVEQFPSEMGVRSVQTLNKHFLGEGVEKTQIVLPQLSMRKLQVETYSEKDLEGLRKQTVKRAGSKG